MSSMELVEFNGVSRYLQISDYKTLETDRSYWSSMEFYGVTGVLWSSMELLEFYGVTGVLWSYWSSMELLQIYGVTGVLWSYWSSMEFYGVTADLWSSMEFYGVTADLWSYCRSMNLIRRFAPRDRRERFEIMTYTTS